tara:strand:+ start:778 stop:1092 length:315 start_codon:yes stop_codon:yes gene_type:complete
MATKTIPSPLFTEETAQSAASIMEAAIPERNEFGMTNSVWRDTLSRSLTAVAGKHGSTFKKGRVYLNDRLGWRRASVYVVNEVTGRTRQVILKHTDRGVTVKAH